MQRKLIVTGTPRSGTGYMSGILSRIGLVCGHEHIFKPWTKRYRWVVEDPKEDNDWKTDANRRKPGFVWDAECSWSAVPWIEQLVSEGAVIVHQIRNPILVIKSLLSRKPYRVRQARTEERKKLYEHGYEGFIGRDRRTPSFRFIDDYLPNVLTSKDEVIRTCQFYVAWNRKITELFKQIPDEQKVVQYVTNPKLSEIVSKIGYDVDAEQQRRALDIVSKATNTHERFYNHLEYSDLTKSLRRYAQELGFEVK